MLFRSCVALVITSFLGITLVACSSHPSQSVISRDVYLQQFVGQSSQYILTHLQLSQIGYQQLGTAQATPQLLHYRIIRPVRVPIPMAQHPTTGIGAVPLNIGIPSHESYDVALTCDLYFRLQQGIATAVYVSGQRC
ncbi:hypothetical protein [Acinetobacter towneri]|uniref:Lipoprotein n=1 Tax=Acinetobacter towneri TaxID=202956 RepID=A0AB35M023_9GAMM|nr:hypothetical protein [Acinetobacter towneri]MDM1718792.1 hypothetical protein [Acinetobacter towneri]MDM1730908.1 hypothetical protein [Acinetobacter towneri]MDM1733544.1 hypothetical protein [Acinetobacter towneri]MDM1735911.1 hypothetical protein [Acinetobacter towneri]MDM1738907.1 hypothetical protein [Acinetobacter towneri]